MPRLNAWFDVLPQYAFARRGGLNRPATLEGGGKSEDAPSYPNPYTVADATTQTNDQTAAYNKALNLNNYSNPFGSQTSTQTGTDPTTGAPIYSTNISTSPQLTQALGEALSGATASPGTTQNAISGDESLGSQYGSLNSELGGIANESQALGMELNPNAAQQYASQGQNAMYNSEMAYLQPQEQQQNEMLQSQLANEGLSSGSQAATTAENNLSQQQTFSNNQAMDSAITQGQQMGINQLGAQEGAMSTESGLLGQQATLLGDQGSNLGQEGSLYGNEASMAQLPYSELTSLDSLIPGYTGTASSSASPANISQDFQNQYTSELNAYNSGIAQQNSTMGGLFGLGSAGIMALALA